MISFGDQLGAQMITLAQLYYIAKENNQEIVFFNELRYFRRGYLFLDVFDIECIELIYANKLSRWLSCIYDKLLGANHNNQSNWKKKMNRIYNNKLFMLLDKLYYYFIMNNYRDYISINDKKNDVHCDNSLLTLDKEKNYDILSGFGTYQDFKKYEDDIINMFAFKEDIQKEANTDYQVLNSIKNKKSVSVHFRRTDYLIMSSLNLSNEYYEKALSYFDDSYSFFVFSDDIQSVKNESYFDRYHDVVYMNTKSAGCDMYLMSLCKHNIIANSTYSFWGGVLNKNKDKIVICPKQFIGESAKDYMYINGNYYPDNFIAI